MDDAVKSTSHKGERRNVYNITFKIKVVNFAEANSIRSAAEMFKVDRKRVREWKQIKIQLTDRAASTKISKWKRLEGGGRKAFNIVLEENLLKWIYDRRFKGLRVSRKLITKKAKIMNSARKMTSTKMYSSRAQGGYVVL